MQDNYDYLEQEINQQVKQLKDTIPQVGKVLDLLPAERYLDSFHLELKDIEPESWKIVLEKLTTAGVISIRKVGDAFFVSLTSKGELIRSRLR